ncbi:MAG: hypothetical protein QGI08_02310, partial [Paracoccaceae bacterium]|nr:hypothetical protein [Paracoccaceae bacterium]
AFGLGGDSARHHHFLIVLSLFQKHCGGGGPHFIGVVGGTAPSRSDRVSDPRQTVAPQAAPLYLGFTLRVKIASGGSIWKR